MTANKATAFCEKHGLEYQAFMPKSGAWISPCPQCMEDKRKACAELDIAKESEAKKERRAEIVEVAIRNVENSGMPKRYRGFDFKPTESGNLAKYKDAIYDKFNGFTFISGDVGTGKTLFACEMLKHKSVYNPLYLSGAELSILSKGDFNTNKVLERVKDSGIIAIDEVNYLLENIFVLDLIVDIAYRDSKPTILIANCEAKSFFDKIGQRMASRISENFRHLEFSGKDLRLGGVQ